MTEQLPDEFGKWMYEFDLGDGVKTPLYLDTLKQVHAVRRDMIFTFLDGAGFDYAAASVLDIACNEGYFLFEMLKRGARHGIGIEGRSENLAKAEFIKQRLGYANCEFRQADVLIDPYETQRHDVVLLLGIIYHVENPIGLIRKAAAAATRYLFVETQLCRPRGTIPYGWGIPDLHYEAEDCFALIAEPNDNPLSAMGSLSLIPNLSAVTTVMRHCGFREIVQLRPGAAVREPQYDAVDRVVLVGCK
jgi:SAM-dependent methyltransferase